MNADRDLGFLIAVVVVVIDLSAGSSLEANCHGSLTDTAQLIPKTSLHCAVTT